MSKTNNWKSQAERLIAIVADANQGWPELAKRNPELARKLRAEQQAIADCRRRAATNRRILDMRLD